MLKMKMQAKQAKVLLISLLLVLFLGWFAVSHIMGQTNDTHQLDWLAGTYGILAIVGGLFGLRVSKQWGGYKSVVGRAVLFLSLGLLFQEFGQLVYAYYAIFKEDAVPYPSLGDIGYFGSVLLYIYATWQLATAAGIRFSIKDRSRKVIAVALPLLMLAGSYFIFLKGYEADFHNPLTILLDFGYPMGQAIYIAIAFMVYLFSKKLLGGVMKNRILLLLLALLLQYSADFNFLFQANRESWTTAGYGDVLYLVSYTLMGLALLNMDTSFMNKKQVPTQALVNGEV